MIQRSTVWQQLQQINSSGKSKILKCKFLSNCLNGQHKSNQRSIIELKTKIVYQSQPCKKTHHQKLCPSKSHKQIHKKWQTKCHFHFFEHSVFFLSQQSNQKKQWKTGCKQKNSQKTISHHSWKKLIRIKQLIFLSYLVLNDQAQNAKTNHKHSFFRKKKNKTRNVSIVDPKKVVLFESTRRLRLSHFLVLNHKEHVVHRKIHQKILSMFFLNQVIDLEYQSQN